MTNGIPLDDETARAVEARVRAKRSPMIPPTPEARAQWRALAEANQVEGTDWWRETELPTHMARSDKQFIAASSPDRVLALLDEVDRLTAALAEAERRASAFEARIDAHNERYECRRNRHGRVICADCGTEFEKLP